MGNCWQASTAVILALVYQVSLDSVEVVETVQAGDSNVPRTVHYGKDLKLGQEQEQEQVLLTAEQT